MNDSDGTLYTQSFGRPVRAGKRTLLTPVNVLTDNASLGASGGIRTLPLTIRSGPHTAGSTPFNIPMHVCALSAVNPLIGIVCTK